MFKFRWVSGLMQAFIKSRYTIVFWVVILDTDFMILSHLGLRAVEDILGAADSGMGVSLLRTAMMISLGHGVGVAQPQYRELLQFCACFRPILNNKP
jgi:hypothetical protein